MIGQKMSNSPQINQLCGPVIPYKWVETKKRGREREEEEGKRERGTRER